MRNLDEDFHNLDSSLPIVRIMHDFEERLDTLQWLYIREAHRFKRQMELPQTQDEIQCSDNSTFTTSRPQEGSSPMDLFEQGTQSQDPN